MRPLRRHWFSQLHLSWSVIPSGCSRNTNHIRNKPPKIYLYKMVHNFFVEAYEEKVSLPYGDWAGWCLRKILANYREGTKNAIQGEHPLTLNLKHFTWSVNWIHFIHPESVLWSETANTTTSLNDFSFVEITFALFTTWCLTGAGRKMFSFLHCFLINLSFPPLPSNFIPSLLAQR